MIRSPKTRINARYELGLSVSPVTPNLAPIPVYINYVSPLSLMSFSLSSMKRESSEKWPNIVGFVLTVGFVCFVKYIE